MEKFFNNPGFIHIGLEIFSHLTFEEVINLRAVSPVMKNFVEQMDIEPIRNPLIAHQKYLSHSNHNPHPRVAESTKAMKPPNIETYASHHPSFLQPQDCSMSSYSSSGYDSMTQSPSSLNREQTKNDIAQHSNNLQRKDIQHYSTNYDNVRGHLRGQFVSYTNNRN